MSHLTHISTRRSVGRLGQVLYDEIKELICQGAFDVDERIPVELLRRRFGVSKQPVMTALHQLAADGLVTITPQVGCRVATYSDQEVADFYRMFGGFEGTIAAAAAERRDDDQVRSLRTICGETGMLADTHDPRTRAERYRRLNREFHGGVHAMSHSPIMAEASRRMWDLSDMLIATVGAPHPLHDVVAERHADHMQVLEAIEARDAVQARSAMEAHIVETAALILEQRDLRPE